MLAVGVPCPHGKKDWYRLRAVPLIEKVEKQASREYGLAGAGLAKYNKALSGECEESAGHVGDRAVEVSLVMSGGGGAEDVLRVVA